MKIKHVILAALGVLAMAGCSSNSYSDELKAEEKLIESFIKRQGITVVETESEVWGENVYWKVPNYDNYYFHLVNQGDTAAAQLEKGDVALLRYRQYTLDAYADTLVVNWTVLDNPDPVEVQYLVSTSTSCTGWQIALQYMKYPQAECKIICPDKLDFSATSMSEKVVPYGYDLKISRIKRF